MFKLSTLILCLLFMAGVSLGQAKLSARLVKQIATLKPANLPQTPGEQRPSNDLRDAALKGPVKRVIEYCEGTIFSIEEFNEQGNRMLSVEFIHGEMSGVSTYGYVDGIRAWHTKFAWKFNPEDPYADEPEWKNLPPKDKRFYAREIRKYDSQGRLIEVDGHYNDGMTFGKSAYEYSGTKRISKDHDREGKLHSTRTETLDSNGHVIEDHLLNELNDRTWIAEYIVDFRGNWTKKSDFFVDKVKGVDRSDPSTRTRAIEYYPEAKASTAPRK